MTQTGRSWVAPRAPAADLTMHTCHPIYRVPVPLKVLQSNASRVTHTDSPLTPLAKTLTHSLPLTADSAS